MKLSVIIPCYNAAKTIEFQLNALVKQEWSQPWEVIVADNGSTDNTRQIVERYIGKLPDLCIVDASSRPGAAHARNTAVKAAKGESLVFCDADDEAGTDWIKMMGEALMQYDFISCRLDIYKLNSMSTQSYMGDSQRTGLRVFGFSPHLPYAGAGSLGIKRSVHEHIGGFDESLLRIEDVDYCIRVQREGVNLYYIPEAIMHYRRRNSMKGIMFQGLSWAFYSVLVYKRYCTTDVSISKRWRQMIRRCIDLILKSNKLLKKDRRSQWLWQISWCLGIFLGCLIHRVHPPFFDHKKSTLNPSSTTELNELIRVMMLFGE